MKKRPLGVTNMMLTQSLKELESDNLITRKQYNEIPPKVEYRITESGKSLFPALHLFTH
ncbi:MAG: winged helix-turn-helix transcriptional regulator [Planctomycetaceae bacterium]|nr:winged helix-turn-helix transcriptional regulator [Planctomycetaceae bacterium]